MKTANGSSKVKPAPGGRPDSADRRRRIVAWMRSHDGPFLGGELAKHFRVSRQSLVQDVAILRARGEDIVATPRGYQLPERAERGHRAILACRHAPERTEEELQILVDHGVKILDVIVEHPLYGELRGLNAPPRRIFAPAIATRFAIRPICSGNCADKRGSSRRKFISTRDPRS